MAFERQQDQPDKPALAWLGGTRPVLLGRGPEPGIPGTPELFQALETEIIPRLMLASSASAAYPGLAGHARTVAPRVFSLHDREDFVKALLSDDAAHAQQLAHAHRAGGHDLPSIFIDLFAWSARELGERWVEDQVSFVDVTIGLCRLHEASHRLAGETPSPAPAAIVAAPSIYIASAPGEQHVFGVLMAGELFRLNGWDVTTDTSGDAAAITRALASRRFDLAGLSASHDAARAGLAALLGAMRKASKNTGVKLVVGGQLFEHSPWLAQEIGADAIAGRGVDAPELARNLLAIT